LWKLEPIWTGRKRRGKRKWELRKLRRVWRARKAKREHVKSAGKDKWQCHGEYVASKSNAGGSRRKEHMREVKSCIIGRTRKKL